MTFGVWSGQCTWVCYWWIVNGPKFYYRWCRYFFYVK